jgi:hypothetical protein
VTDHERDRIVFYHLRGMMEDILERGGDPEDWIGEKAVEVAARLVAHGRQPA